MAAIQHDAAWHIELVARQSAPSGDATICAIIITVSTRIVGRSTGYLLAAWLLGLAAVPAAGQDLLPFFECGNPFVIA
jgi:hypothetical protein